MKTRWGIISTAKIGREKVIPAIQRANNCEVVAIASRNLENAKSVADQLNIPTAYGSYAELFNDSNIDVVYNPLPNHLHVPITLEALAAGKHVLCEKPLGLNAADAQNLLTGTQKFPKLKVMEAFMYRFHPQWQKAKQLVDSGVLGEVKTIQSIFSYYNTDENNIRNKANIGGGALMDIGCYCISYPRFVFGREPQKTIGLVDRDPIMKTDRITSGMLDFGNGLSATFTCSTQLQPYQRTHIIGTKGRIEIVIPCNAPQNEAIKILVETADGIETVNFPVADQYSLQAEVFAASIIDNTPVPTPLSDGVANMKVIDALLKSVDSFKWEEV